MNESDIAQLAKSSEVDQMIAGLTAFAHASRAYYDELTNQGFTKAQAFELVKHWQSNLFSKPSDSK